VQASKSAKKLVTVPAWTWPETNSRPAANIAIAFSAGCSFFKFMIGIFIYWVRRDGWWRWKTAWASWKTNSGMVFHHSRGLSFPSHKAVMIRPGTARMSVWQLMKAVCLVRITCILQSSDDIDAG
jgi:hypothetical protein